MLSGTSFSFCLDVEQTEAGYIEGTSRMSFTNLARHGGWSIHAKNETVCGLWPIAVVVYFFQASAEAKFGSLYNQKNSCYYFAIQKMRSMVMAENKLPKAQR